ncbi:M23 family metallopeptidase [Bogoriella caseilytica]|nr:M23 family metallopeptidase [Bogoriella caseilytica]
MRQLLLRLTLVPPIVLALVLLAALPVGAWPVDGRELTDGDTAPAVRTSSERSVGTSTAPRSAQIPSTRGYVWPTGGATEVLRGFEAPSDPWGPGHRGVDLAHPAGEEVLSAGAGVVAFAGWVVDRYVVSVDHADGLRTTYEPVEPSVASGDAVSAGDLLGHLASGHCPASAECLHWGARTGPNSYIDPMILLDERPVIRLLPVGRR